MHTNLRKVVVALGTCLLGSSLIFGAEVGIYVPYGVAANGSSQLVVDTYGNRVLEVKGDKVTVVAGKNALNGGFVDDEVAKAYFNQPIDVVQNSKKEIFVTDSENNVIRKIAEGKVTTLAGKLEAGYKDGARNEAQFNLPNGLAVDSSDHLYVADTLNHTIRKIAVDGTVSTLAGTGKSGYKDGSLSEALFNEPTDVVAFKDAFYVVDSGNQAIRKIENGKVTTLAGGQTPVVAETSYKQGGYVDGAKAQFNFPKSLIVLDNGEILVADTLNNALRKIKIDGTVVTVLDAASGLEAPVGLVYQDGKVVVAQKWKEKVMTFSLEAEKIVKEALTHEEWLTQTPFLPKSDQVQLWLEGVQITPQDVKAQLIDSRVYLPVRAIAEATGGVVGWDEVTQSATVTLDGKVVQVPSTGENVKTVEGRILTGVRYLAESLGLSVEWVADYYAVVITK